VKLLGNAVERERHLEMRVAHRKVPELVLQYDGHFFRILLAQARRDAYARRLRGERDIEMMLARQRAGLRYVCQHASHHCAQRLLRQEIVADVIDAHAVHPKPQDSSVKC
jgi:hypothetical protein